MWEVVVRNRITGYETVHAVTDDKETAVKMMRIAQRGIEYAWLDYNEYVFIREKNDETEEV